MLLQGPVSVQTQSSQHPEQLPVLRVCRLEVQSMLLHHVQVLHTMSALHITQVTYLEDTSFDGNIWNQVKRGF